MANRPTDETDASDADHNRRRFLSLLGASSASISLAGCQVLLPDDEAANGGDATTTTTDTPTATATATDTATATATATDGDAGTETGTETDETETDANVVRTVSVGARQCSGQITATCQQAQTLSSDVSSDTTLGGNCNQITVTGAVEVRSGATLTIEPGTILRFGQGGSLTISGSSALVADGTCAEPIVFTGEQATRGYWQGLYFTESDQQRSSMSNCLVEYAGSDDFYYGNVGACLTVTEGSRLSVDNCTFRESAGYGVNFGSTAQLTAFDSVVATANTDGAAYVYNSTAHFLSGTGTYAGNDRDIVYVNANSDIGSGMDVQWDAIDVPYRVGGQAELSGDGHLTIQGGSTVEFTQNSGLTVHSSAQLTANGMDPQTEAVQPITFTGVQKTRGYWNGLYFTEADQVPSTLRYCVVEYGGGQEYYYASVPANVAVANGARVTVSNTTIRESGGYGFNLETDVNVNAFDLNQVTSNTSGAGYVRDNTAHHVAGTGEYSGNDEDRITVQPGRGIGEDLEVQWDALDVPYFVRQSDVEITGALTVEAGATVEFGQNASIMAYDGGSLTAVGMVPETEESRPVTFTGSQKTRGYWKGIYFSNTDRVENHLSNVVVEYGGSDEFYYADRAANVAVTNDSRARISGSTLRESGGYGFDIQPSATIDAFSTNTVTANEEGAGFTSATVVHTLSDTCSYTGNDEDRVTVYAGTVGENDEVTWDAIDVPYFFTGGRSDIYGEVTIDAGATLRFDQDAALGAFDGGALNAVGTSDSPITFTGDQATAGYWKGIYFANTRNANNRLEHCVVEYAGSAEFYYASEPANVAVTENSTATLSNSTFRNSAGYGYTVTSDSSISGSGNSFANNALGSLLTG